MLADAANHSSADLLIHQLERYATSAGPDPENPTSQHQHHCSPNVESFDLEFGRAAEH